jgi:RHS repeat-associated protein
MHVRFLFYLLIFPILVRAEMNSLFPEGEDPAIFQHVNVISGHLSLVFQDAVVQGPKPIPLVRTYSSSGAFEYTWGIADILAGYRKGRCTLHYGWNLLSHIHLSIQPSEEREGFRAHLVEPSGNVIQYSFSHKEEGARYTIWLKADTKVSQSTGRVSARTNPQNNLLRMDLKKAEVVLVLPDGGMRIYQGVPLHHYKYKEGDGAYLYYLQKEILPSKHELHYLYYGGNELKRIESRNPGGQKLYAFIDFKYANLGDGCETKVYTSDGKWLNYQMSCVDTRDYLTDVYSSCKPKEKINLVSGRRETAFRMGSLEVVGKQQLKVHYYLPQSEKQEKKWAIDPSKKPFHIDKVESIEAPLGPNGQNITVARFTYEPGRTDVRDAQGLLTRYYYKEDQLTLIQYYDAKEQLHSSQKFYWDGSFLICKVMCNEKDEPLFAKTFVYNQGNIVEEVLWGNLTGQIEAPFAMDGLTALKGAEKYRKTYLYDTTRFNLLSKEAEEEGPCYEYFYKQDTDLLLCKLTKDPSGPILLRQFYEYDQDHLLISEITDNGKSALSHDKEGVTQRVEKHYKLNPSTGLAEEITEVFWDPASGLSKLIKKVQLKYLKGRVVEEALFDAKGEYRYTIYTEYDDFGHVIRKTTPLGAESSYSYDELGRLREEKSPGSLKKVYSYDAAGRKISSFEPEINLEKVTVYDTKNRVILQTDERGNPIQHTYDCFGNRSKSRLPCITNSQHSVHEPILEFEYDVQSNLTLAKTALGATTRTTYNLLKKPTLIIQPDGTQIRHFYNKNGTLARTIYPDLTEVEYTYDIFQQLLSKTIYSEAKEELSKEIFEYDSFQLRSCTDARGLKTTFTYNGQGRKLSETAKGRITTYEYDALGFLERTDFGASVLVQKHNVAGLVEEQWEESSGNRENEMHFFYDKEARKEKLIRKTSQGEATDLLQYESGKLIAHTDPLGAVTQFIYNEHFINHLKQRVLQKTTIDPLGNSSIETYDAANHLVSLERKDPQANTVFKEEVFYDGAGNKKERVSHVYAEGRHVRDISVFWEYDAMGRVVREVEAGEKRTQYKYDLSGRLKCKTIPSGMELYYTYDGLGRLLSLKSSDKTIDYQYTYGSGPEAIEMQDLSLPQRAIKRTYNEFGELVKEVQPTLGELSWSYDLIGRPISFILPDKSSVQYLYNGSHMSAVQRKDPQGELRYEHLYTNFDVNGHVAEESLIYNLGQISTTHDLCERPAAQSSSWMNLSISYGKSGLVEHIDNSFFAKKHYSYDALNQLKSEGKQQYIFDSLGNPGACPVNALNQITSMNKEPLLYDFDGNLKERGDVNYSYDALGRLTEILQPDKKILYQYDPLSRLSTKQVFQKSWGSWNLQSSQNYLYDKDKEIGTLDPKGNLLDFKVLGLGLKGDIGAAVAVELDGWVYAPLHDFGGNMVALVSDWGYVYETYEMDAFGRETQNHRNPWRFCSKRSEEGLVFFGLRFYSPSLGRWMTPDPSGFSDGANLYLYVLNSPLNRLDLFGLYSEDFFEIPKIEILVPMVNIKDMFGPVGFVCEGSINGVSVDFYVSHNQWHKLQFSAEELESTHFDLANHMHELLPKEGNMFGLVTLGNGIATSLKDFQLNNFVIGKELNGALILSLHNPTHGLLKDIARTNQERAGLDTPTVCNTRQFMIWATGCLAKTNPDALWLMIPHSENGVITKRAIEGMSLEHQDALRRMLHIFAVAPAESLSMEQAASVINVYSAEDQITGFGFWGHAADFARNPNYDIRVLECRSTPSEMVLGFADHCLLMPTYRGAWTDHISHLKKTTGFYGAAKNLQNR